jgi:hypothetical protein
MIMMMTTTKMTKMTKMVMVMVMVMVMMSVVPKMHLSSSAYVGDDMQMTGRSLVTDRNETSCQLRCNHHLQCYHC